MASTVIIVHRSVRIVVTGVLIANDTVILGNDVLIILTASITVDIQPCLPMTIRKTSPEDNERRGVIFLVFIFILFDSKSFIVQFIIFIQHIDIQRYSINIDQSRRCFIILTISSFFFLYSFQYSVCCSTIATSLF